MLRDFNLSSLCAIEQIESCIAQSVNIFAPQHVPDFGSVVALFQELTLLGILVIQSDDVEGSATLVGVSETIDISPSIN
jgi:hypothetical protein